MSLLHIPITCRRQIRKREASLNINDCVHGFCYVDIVGSGEMFQSRLQYKRARAIFFLNSMFM